MFLQVARTELEAVKAQPTTDGRAGADAAQGVGRQARDSAALFARANSSHCKPIRRHWIGAYSSLSFSTPSSSFPEFDPALDI